jgi:Uma2 family endonuclease
MPSVITLGDLAEMIAMDGHGHRYETSPEGLLSVMPPPDSEHAMIASRLLVWLAMPGRPSRSCRRPEFVSLGRVAMEAGYLILPSGRSPNRAASGADTLLVVEIVSPGSEALDEIVKRHEYAAAAVPRYWVVDRDPAQTVTLHRRGLTGESEVVTKMPLAWFLNTAPADHLD